MIFVGREDWILKKAGKIFADVAIIYAQPIAGGPKLVEQRKIIEIFARAKDYERLESLVKLETVVLAGVSALRNGLDHELRQYLPVGYENFVLFGAECEPLELDLTSDEHQRALERVIATVAEAMHDEWVKSHLTEFEGALGMASEARAVDVQFKRLFVPFPILGWRVADRYYQMALKLLGNLSLPKIEERLQAEYEKRTKLFCVQNGIFNVETLQNILMEGSKFYYALSGTAEEKLTRQQSAQGVARAILKEI